MLEAPSRGSLKVGKVPAFFILQSPILESVGEVYGHMKTPKTEALNSFELTKEAYTSPETISVKLTFRDPVLQIASPGGEVPGLGGEE